MREGASIGRVISSLRNEKNSYSRKDLISIWDALGINDGYKADIEDQSDADFRKELINRLQEESSRRAADAQEEQKRQILPLREIRRGRSGRNCCRTEIKSVDASVKKCEKQRNGRKLLTIGLKFDKLSAQSCISIRSGKYDNQRSSH